MTTLKESTQCLVEKRRKSLAEAERALELLELLPPELQVLYGEADVGWDKVLRVTLYQSDNKDIDLLRITKMVGTQELAPKMLSPNSWYAEGKLALLNEQGEVKISIYGLPKPRNCRIESYTETVTKYKAICNETEEEIK